MVDTLESERLVNFSSSSLVFHPSIRVKTTQLIHMLFLVFAQQGYFVVAINPTGSTTFGQGEKTLFIHRTSRL